MCHLLCPHWFVPFDPLPPERVDPFVWDLEDRVRGRCQDGAHVHPLDAEKLGAFWAALRARLDEEAMLAKSVSCTQGDP